MDIKELKKELGLSNKDIAEFFDLKEMTYANSSAKKRYEAALCNFYAFIKSKEHRQN
jgi:isopentenyldiphosphate isomerase